MRARKQRALSSTIKPTTKPKHPTNQGSKITNWLKHLTPSILINSTTTTSTASTNTLQQSTLSSTPALNLPWGSHLECPKSNRKITRIYSININGIGTTKANFQTTYDRTAISELQQQLLEQDVDILGMSETNLYWPTQNTIQEITTQLNKGNRGTTLITSCSPLRPNPSSIYQPGGTAMITNAQIAARIQERLNDPLGRWSGALLKGRGGKTLLLLQIYQVVQNSTAGEWTAFAQQRSILRQQARTDSPREAFTKDLDCLLKQITKASPNVGMLIMGDANDNILRPQSKFGQLMDCYSLFDVHRYVHFPNTPPETYLRGTSQIDYMFATPQLLPYIEACGFGQYHSFAHSDHRVLWMDIHLSRYLGNDHMIEPNIATRTINSADRKQVADYRQHLSSYWNNHNLQQRTEVLNSLLSAYQSNPTETKREQLIRMAETFDSDITKGLLHSERSSKPRYKTPWSPKLIASRHRMLWWKTLLSYKLTGRDFHKTLKYYENGFQTNEVPATDQTKTTIRRKIRAATKEHREILRQAAEHRDQFLEAQIDKAVITDEDSRKRILSTLQKKEAQRELHRTLKRVAKKRTNGNLKHILVPYLQEDPSSSPEVVYYPKFLAPEVQEKLQWKEEHDPETISTILIERNRRHYAQAEGTPFTTSELLNTFGRSACTSLADQFLLGQHQVEHHSAAVQEVLAALQQNQLPQVDVLFTAAELQQAFRVWRESTSTSPSGVHLGHYKSLLPMQTWEEASPEDTSITDLFYESLATRLNIATTLSYSYQRWHTIITCVIEKSPGNPRLDKIRIIHLLEADANRLLGMQWNRRLSRHAEAYNALHPEQWGNRPGKSAIDTALLKTCTYHLFHLTRTGGGTFDNDATACYDRIVMSLAILRGRQLGLPKQAASLLDDFLTKANYYIRTQVSQSTESYKSDSNFHLHGPGQGTIFGPPVWMVVSTLILELVPIRAAPIRFCTPDGKINLKRFMDGFVDDTTGWTNDFHHSIHYGTNLSRIRQQLQTLSQWWEELLTATGGKLELPKCFFYVIHFTFNDDGLPSLHSFQQHEPATKLTVRDSITGQVVSIKHYPITKAHRTLGVMLSPNLCYKSEMEFLENKIHSLCTRLLPHNLNATLTRRFLLSMSRPSVSYSAPISTIPRAQWHRIQKRLNRLVLNKLHFSQNTPSALLHAPLQSGGLEIPDGYSEQGSQHVLSAIKHIRTQTTVGDYLMTVLKWTHMNSGYISPPLSANALSHPHVYAPWVTTTQNYLNESSCSLQISNLPDLTLPRQNDKSIMEEALNIYGPNAVLTLQRINACRLFLQVIFLSDICSGDGRSIQPTVFDSQTPTVASVSKLLWPFQPNPGKTSWLLFHRLLRTFCYPGTHRLRQPLGAWNPQETNREWTAYFDPTSQCVWYKQHNSWFKASATIHRTKLTSPNTSLATQSSPDPSLIPITLVTQTSHSSTWSYTKQRNQLTHPSDTGPTFLPPLLEWERQLLLDVELHISKEELNHHLINDPTLLLVSDGGSRPHLESGTFGWILATNTHTLVTCGGPVTGIPISSYRCEGMGRLSALLFLHKYCEHHDLQPTGQLLTYLDNKSVIQTEGHLLGYRHLFPTVALTSDVDVFLQLLELHRTLPWQQIQTYHVKAHQDDHTKFTELSRPAQLNVLADAIATSGLNKLENTKTPPTYPLPAGRVHLFHEDALITRRQVHTLRFSLAETNLREYLCKRFFWTSDQFYLIDWLSYGRARSSQHATSNLFTSKLLIGWLPTKSRLARYDSLIDPTCPFCNVSVETPDHPWQCHSALEWRVMMVHDFGNYLTKLHTCPALYRSMMRTLRHALRLPPDTNPHTWLHSDLLLAGLIPKAYTAQQAQFLRKNPHPRRRHSSGEQWTTSVICYLWTRLHSQWRTRCNRIHSSQIQLERTLLTSTAKSLLQLQPSVSVQDHDLFPRDSQEFLQSSTSRIRAWIQVTGPAIRAAVNQCHRRRTTGQTTISAFFRPPRKPPYSDSPQQATLPAPISEPNLPNPHPNQTLGSPHRLPFESSATHK